MLLALLCSLNDGRGAGEASSQSSLFTADFSAGEAQTSLPHAQTCCTTTHILIIKPKISPQGHTLFAECYLPS